MNKKFILVLLFISLTPNLFSQIIFNNSDELLSFGLANNKTLKLNKEIALLQMKQAKFSIMPFLPKFSLSWNEYDQINKYQQDVRSKNISMSATQLIFDKGESLLNYQYNRMTSLCTDIQTDRSIEEYRQLLLEKYYGYLHQQKTITLKKSLLESAIKELELIKYKFEKGMTVKSDVLEYEIFCKELQNEIISNNRNADLLLNELKQLLETDEEIQINYLKEQAQEYTYKLSDKISLLTDRYLSENSELKELETRLLYKTRIDRINTAAYLPSIYISGDISFNGKKYPLTQPDYSLKLIFSFENIPWIKTDIEHSSGLTNKKMNKLSNSAKADIIPDFIYFSNKKINKLQSFQLQNEIDKTKRKLKKEFMELVYKHDELVLQYSIQSETIRLLELKLDATKYEAEQGLIKTSDYIRDVNTLSEAKEQQIKLYYELNLILNKIKLLTGGTSEN